MHTTALERMRPAVLAPQMELVPRNRAQLPGVAQHAMQRKYSFKSEEIIFHENINWKPVHKMFEYIRIYFNDQLMEELNEDVFLINYFLYYNEERRRKSNAITKIRKINEEKWQCYYY